MRINRRFWSESNTKTFFTVFHRAFDSFGRAADGAYARRTCCCSRFDICNHLNFSLFWYTAGVSHIPIIVNKYRISIQSKRTWILEIHSRILLRIQQLAKSISTIGWAHRKYRIILIASHIRKPISSIVICDADGAYYSHIQPILHQFVRRNCLASLNCIPNFKNEMLNRSLSRLTTLDRIWNGLTT